MNDFGQLFVDRQTGIGGFSGIVGRIRNFIDTLCGFLGCCRCSIDGGFNSIRRVPIGVPCRQISGAPRLAIRIVSFFAFLNSSLRRTVQLIIGVVLLRDQVNRYAQLRCLILCPCVKVDLSGPVSNNREIHFTVLIRPLLHPVRHGFINLLGSFSVGLSGARKHLALWRSAVRSCHSIKRFLNRNLELSDETESLLDSEREVFKPLRQLNQPLPRHRRDDGFKRLIGDTGDGRDNIIEILEGTQQTGSSAVVVPEFQNLVSGLAAGREYVPKHLGNFRPKVDCLVNVAENILKCMHPLAAYGVLCCIQSVLKRL